MSKQNVFPMLCLPPLGFWVDVLNSQVPVFAMSELYLKQTLRNRLSIAAANQPEILTVPIIGKTKRNPIDRVEIDYSENWQRKHWQAFNTAYKNAPFFEFYNYRFEDIWFGEYESLGEFNFRLNSLFVKMLKLDRVELLVSKEVIHTLDIDDEWKQSPFEYDQVFMQRNGFVKEVSCLDALFNLGPELKEIIYASS